MMCKWSEYEKYVDWDYYSKTNGDCTSCKNLCNLDLNCGGVECGGGWCSWWKVGSCPIEVQHKPVRRFTGSTCTKGNDF